MKKKKILMLTTGGTIASGPTENGLSPVLSPDELQSYITEFRDVCELECQALCSLDSTNITPAHWQMIVRAIRDRYDDCDAFLICHGTDTMAYTAAALSYLIQDAQKPILITGAQRSILLEITDAKKNLRDSILFALDERTKGVNLVFDGNLIVGTRAKKTSSFSYNAFSSINFPALARIQNDRVIYYVPPCPASGPVRFYDQLNPRLFLLKLTPGISPDIIPLIVRLYDCILVESFGVGGLPDSILDPLCSELARYEPHKKVLVITTQVTYEGSAVDTYEVGRRVHNRVPFLETRDMTLEAAYTKLMWILGGKISSWNELETAFYSPINYDLSF